MEQRRASGKNHWYHETQARSSHADVQPLAPEAANVNDRFLLDMEIPETLTDTLAGWPAIARKASTHLFPDAVTTSRLATLSSYDRLSTALTVAQVCGVQRLCNHYAARLAPQPGPDSSRESNLRLAQITQYARQLATSPFLIDAASRKQLIEVGLTDCDIVTFNQIIGFVGFQARVVAILQVLNGQPARWLPGLDMQQDAPVECFSAGQACWQPDIPPPAPGYLRAEQERALQLARRVPALAQIADGLIADETALVYLAGLARYFPEDERHLLVALLSARINGSGAGFRKLSVASRDATLPDAIRNGERALLAWSHSRPLERAIIQAVQVTIRSPDRFSAVQFAPMLTAGLSESEAAEILSAAAFFGWLNRLEIGLGAAT